VHHIGLSTRYNGREFVDIRNVQLPTAGANGSWSISWLAQENVGHTGSIRVMIGGDTTGEPFMNFMRK
jgi:hypothetical protein